MLPILPARTLTIWPQPTAPGDNGMHDERIKACAMCYGPVVTDAGKLKPLKALPTQSPMTRFIRVVRAIS